MNNSVKISIVIPVYNVEKYIQECIESLRCQTFQDFEIICVDDGSTDKTLGILRDFKLKDNRISILQQHHSGAGAARNNGIKLARGKYIQFLDSDDYFEPTMLQELYEHAEKFNADITVCSAKKVDEEGNIIESGNPNSPINLDITPLETPFSWKDYKKNIFCMFNVPSWNKLYLKDLITSNNLTFQNISCCNDVSFGHISKILANKIVVFKKELINYRYNRNESITKHRAEFPQNIILSLFEVKSFLEEQELYNELKEGFLSAVKMHICWELPLFNETQYNEFLTKFKEIMPLEFEQCKSILKSSNYITPEYLNKVIANKKVMLWGASLFIKKVLANEKEANPNIIGFIDRNSASWGKQCGNYKIYPPEAITQLNPQAVLLTVYSNNKIIYDLLKDEFKTNYPNIELLPNIFEGDTNG